jgi:hypothetical protein
MGAFCSRRSTKGYVSFNGCITRSRRLGLAFTRVLVDTPMYSRSGAATKGMPWLASTSPIGAARPTRWSPESSSRKRIFESACKFVGPTKFFRSLLDFCGYFFVHAIPRRIVRVDVLIQNLNELRNNYQKPVRIGVNWGSLDQARLTRIMDENSRLEEPKDAREVTMEAIVASALNSAALAEKYRLPEFSFRGAVSVSRFSYSLNSSLASRLGTSLSRQQPHGLNIATAGFLGGLDRRLQCLLLDRLTTAQLNCIRYGRLGLRLRHALARRLGRGLRLGVKYVADRTDHVEYPRPLSSAE